MAGSKRGIEAGRAYVRASLDDSLFVKGLRGLKNSVIGFGKALPSIASGIFVFDKLAASVSGAASKIMESISDIATISKTAKAFGATTEQASKLFGVFEASGSGNARENIESLVTLSGRIKDVLAGTGEESKKLFDGLSVSAESLAGMSIDEQFFALHEAIMQLPDPMDRVNRLMLAFGEDGGKTLIGTLSKSTPELRAMAESYKITALEAANATRAQEAMNRLSAAVSKIWREIAVAVAPVIVQFVDGIEKVKQQVVEWVRSNQALMQGLEGIKNALASGDIKAAAEIGMAALELAWIQTTNAIRDNWDEWIDGLDEALGGFIGRAMTKLREIQASIANTLLDLNAGEKDREASAAEFKASEMRKRKNAIAEGWMEGTWTEQDEIDLNDAEIKAGFARSDAIAAAGTELTPDDFTSKRDVEAADARKKEEEDAAKKLADLYEAAKKKADEAEKAAELAEVVPAKEDVKAAVAKADTAVNSAAQVNTSSGMNAFIRAFTGVRSNDPTAIAKEGNKLLADIKKETREMRRQGVVLVEASTR